MEPRLTFFTSNITKLAHARHVAERYPVRVIGFRAQTYHANYYEPRHTSRRELLEESYYNAVIQCRKAGINIDNQIFFLEDTSVRIEALSDETKNIPGLDIKYWMEEMTFDRLDRLIKEAENDRRARVRSDIVLHIPAQYREEWKEEGPYKVFTGVQDGLIVEAESTYGSNLVFPWLDNRTFNKWFQPIGVDRPLGALEIDVADKVDFRRRSLESLFSFVAPTTKVEKPLKQGCLDLYDKPNFVLCGYTCSGKTTTSQFLARRYGYLHVEASDFIHLSFYQRHGFRNDLSINDFAEQALNQKPNIAADQVVEYLEDDLSLPAVISGFRSIVEVEKVLSSLEYSGRSFRVIFIDADQEERFRRLRERKRVGDKIRFEDFQLRDEQQYKMGLDNIRKDSGTQCWRNMDSMGQYYEFLDSQIAAKPVAKVDIHEKIEKFRRRDNVKLEEAILVALLSIWINDENRRPFKTTTEIAALLKDLFVNIDPKHKDNVSRYFNQDFRSYYEVNYGSRGNRGFRLSNTGFGKAFRTLLLP